MALGREEPGRSGGAHHGLRRRRARGAGAGAGVAVGHHPRRGDGRRRRRHRARLVDEGGGGAGLAADAVAFVPLAALRSTTRVEKGPRTPAPSVLVAAEPRIDDADFTRSYTDQLRPKSRWAWRVAGALLLAGAIGGVVAVVASNKPVEVAAPAAPEPTPRVTPLEPDKAPPGLATGAVATAAANRRRRRRTTTKPKAASGPTAATRKWPRATRRRRSIRSRSRSHPGGAVRLPRLAARRRDARRRQEGRGQQAELALSDARASRARACARLSHDHDERALDGESYVRAAHGSHRRAHQAEAQRAGQPQKPAHDAAPVQDL